MRANLQAGLRWVARGALDLLYPSLRIGCRAQVAEPGNLCAACWQNIDFLDGPAYQCCGLPFDLDPGSETLCAACFADPPSFDRARAVMRYDNKSRGPILALKFHYTHDGSGVDGITGLKSSHGAWEHCRESSLSQWCFGVYAPRRARVQCRPPRQGIETCVAHFRYHRTGNLQ